MKLKVYSHFPYHYQSSALADAPFNDKFETPSWDIETSIYPNPNNGSFQLNIQSDSPETFEVKVVNLIGKTITKKR
ncbi:MAG: T9SS type A sorting domain-containing protein [Bacteroidia bacterium]